MYLYDRTYCIARLVCGINNNNRSSMLARAALFGGTAPKKERGGNMENGAEA
jgi:hypothetical protein